MLVTKQAFISRQTAFFNHVKATPYYIDLETVSAKPTPAGKAEGFDIAAFVGDSNRESVTYRFHALYEKEITDRMREKYGLPREVNGIVYLSPRQLTPVYGDYHLDWNTTKVHFEGRIQVINHIVYLEEMYGSCVGVQIFVKDDNKGG